MHKQHNNKQNPGTSSAPVPDWVQVKSPGVILKLLIQPKASKTEIVGPQGDPARLKIRIAAPPVDGEANRELMLFFKKLFRGTSAQFELIRGESSRLKDIYCGGVTLAEVLARFSDGAKEN